MLDVFRRIHEILPPLDGWCTVERACEYAAIVMGLRVEVSVVIGVWGGRDVIPIALAHQETGVGRCLAIDPWLAEASVEGQEGANREWWASQERHELVHDRFLETLQKARVRGFVEIHRKRAREVEPPEGIGLLIVDGNHGPDALRDVQRWAPKVRIGGVVYCDDITWTGGAVQEAVEFLLVEGFTELYRRDTGAFFQRVRSLMSGSSL